MDDATSKRAEQARERIMKNKFALDAWAVLIKENMDKKIADSRDFYEELVTEFPTSGKFWKMYIDAEMKARNYEKVESLFQRCLIKILNIDLWKCYLSYVKDTKGRLPSFRETMAQAFDFALEKIGMDILAYSIWNDYVNFLKSVDAVGSYAENQKITAVRKVYQKGIQTPMMNIEQLWKDYCAYEMSINPMLAKKMIDDRSRDYLNVRRVAKEYENYTRSLDRNAPCVYPTRSMEEMKQVKSWKKYIAWEKSNPLKTEDHVIVARRVMFAYEQCLLCLGYHADIWYEAADFLDMSSKLLKEKGEVNISKLFAEEAAGLYERAISSFMKNHMLLYFAYADFEESRLNFENTHRIYQKFLENESVDPTLCYVLYMRFARRSEGMDSYRTVFKMARKDKRCQHHIYVAGALIEYYCSKDKTVAAKIFEIGMDKYGHIPEYVLAFTDFLSHLNDKDKDMRPLFEKVLSCFNNTGSEEEVNSFKQLWLEYLKYECQEGDLEKILAIETRRKNALQQLGKFEGYETAMLVDRYRFLDLFPCSQDDLKSFGYKDIVWMQSLPPALRTEFFTNDCLRYALPDPKQMKTFKPNHLPVISFDVSVPGTFPFPPAAASLLKRIPPPNCFQGPYVLINEFMTFVSNLQLPEKFEEIPLQTYAENNLSADIFTRNLYGHVKRTQPTSADSDDEIEESSKKKQATIDTKVLSSTPNESDESVKVTVSSTP